jgi:hypothetical protein
VNGPAHPGTPPADLRACQRCGDVYEPTDPDQKYCTRACSSNAHSARRHWRRHQRQVCESKRTFQNHGHATKTAAQLNAKGLNLIPYQCTVCRLWHHTTNRGTPDAGNSKPAPDPQARDTEDWIPRLPCAHDTEPRISGGGDDGELEHLVIVSSNTES